MIETTSEESLLQKLRQDYILLVIKERSYSCFQALIKRPSSRAGTPLMRPMSASSGMY